MLFVLLIQKMSLVADQLEPGLLLLAAPFLVECLTYIFNPAVVTETMPGFWKTAYVRGSYIFSSKVCIKSRSEVWIDLGYQKNPHPITCVYNFVF